MKKIIPFLLIFLLFSFMFVMPVSADDDETPIYRTCEICGATHDMAQMPFASRMAFEWHEMVFGGKFVEDDGSPTSLFNVLKFDTRSGIFATLWSTVQSLYSQMSVIGLILVVAYASIEVSGSFVSTSVSPEVLFKFLLKYMLGLLVMWNLTEFISLLMDMSSLIFNTVFTASDLNMSFANMCVYEEYITHDMFDGFIEMAILFFPWLIIWITKGVINLYCWYRVLDIAVRVIFAPVGAPDVLMSGTRGSGWRYLKNLFASCLQGAVVIAIFYTYSMIMNSMVVNNGFAIWLVATVLSVVILLSMFKAQEIARNIVN